MSWLNDRFHLILDISVHAAQTHPTEAYFLGTLLIVSVVSILLYES